MLSYGLNMPLKKGVEEDVSGIPRAGYAAARINREESYNGAFVSEHHHLV